MGVSDAYGSYRSYRSSLGILKFFEDEGKCHPDGVYHCICLLDE